MLVDARVKHKREVDLFAEETIHCGGRKQDERVGVGGECERRARG
jgi:hypothetical protein